MDDDEAAFTAYVAGRQEAVRRTAHLLCGDWHWADDLAQATFIRLARHWHRIRDREALNAWVRTSLLRAYLSDTRRLWRRRERPMADLPDQAVPADHTAWADGRILFEAALRRLSPRQRATIVCRYYDGLDVAETAAVLHCSTGTVKTQTARALRALRVHIGPDYPVDWPHETPGRRPTPTEVKP